MENIDNRFYEGMDESIKKNSSACSDTEVNKPNAEKHDIVVLIDNSNSELNKNTSKKIKKIKKFKKIKKIKKIYLNKNKNKKNKKPKNTYHSTSLTNNNNIATNNAINKTKKLIFLIIKKPRNKKSSKKKKNITAKNDENVNNILIKSNDFIQNQSNIVNNNYFNSSGEYNFPYSNNISNQFSNYNFYEEERLVQKNLNSLEYNSY